MVAPWSDGNQDDVRVRGIDPDTVVVVAARRAAQRAERLAAVDRLPRHDARGVDDVGILGIDLDLREIVAARHHARDRR